MESAESVILVEGFYDRAFWSGWLKRLGCDDARPLRASGDRGQATDPFGKPVGREDFAFYSPSRRFIRVRPCHGESQMRDALARRLKERTTAALRWIIFNRDADTTAGPDDDADERANALTRQLAERYEGEVGEPRMVRLPDSAIAVVPWLVRDLPVPELPAKQTLERLVCAALVEAFPERGSAVAGWLSSLRGSAASPKAYAWAHMAGFYPESGCDEFYQQVWDDPVVALALERRLDATGAGELVRRLVA